MIKPVLIAASVAIFSSFTIYQEKTELVGKHPIESVKGKKEYPWYTEGYNKYIPEKNAVNEMRLRSLNISFVVFAGSWCEDTQNLLPKFMKSLEVAKIPVNAVEIIWLDKNKKSPENDAEKNKVTKLPTFIVYRNKKEIGRIEESVQHSIEKDLSSIMK